MARERADAHVCVVCEKEGKREREKQAPSAATPPVTWTTPDPAKSIIPVPKDKQREKKEYVYERYALEIRQ